MFHQNPSKSMKEFKRTWFFPCFPTFSHVFSSKNLKIHHCYHPTVATVAVVAGHPGGLLRLLRAAPPRAARHLGHLQPLRGPRHRGLYNRCATSINIWVNYNDLTATSLEIIVSKGNHPKMALIQVSEIL